MKNRNRQSKSNAHKGHCIASKAISNPASDHRVRLTAETYQHISDGVYKSACYQIQVDWNHVTGELYALMVPDLPVRPNEIRLAVGYSTNADGDLNISRLPMAWLEAVRDIGAGNLKADNLMLLIADAIAHFQILEAIGDLDECERVLEGIAQLVEFLPSEISKLVMRDLPQILTEGFEQFSGDLGNN